MHRQLEDIFHHFSVVRNDERIIPHGRIKWLYEQAKKTAELEKRVEELEGLLEQADKHSVRNGKEIMKLTDEKAELEFKNQRLKQALEDTKEFLERMEKGQSLERSHYVGYNLIEALNTINKALEGEE